MKSPSLISLTQYHTVCEIVAKLIYTLKPVVGYSCERIVGLIVLGQKFLEASLLLKTGPERSSR